MTDPQLSVAPDLVPRLKQLWGLGLSALEVGAEIGLVGDPQQVREAVLRAVEEVQKLPASSARPRNRSRGHPERSNLPPRQRTAARKEIDEDADPMFAVDGFDGSPDEFDLAIPLEQRRKHDELTADTCHWPVGDPRSPTFFFCGAKTHAEECYCLHHCWRAYHRPHRRKAA